MKRFNFFGDSSFDSFFSDMIYEINGSVGLNKIDNDSHTVFYLDIPGFRKEDLKIQYKNDYILITGNKKIGSLEKKISKTIPIYQKFDFDKIEAKVEDGILILAFPKKEIKDGINIEIKNIRIH